MDWDYTAHALTRMRQRRILREQVDAVLAWPASNQPDPKRQAGVRLYVGGGITVSVNEDDRVVLTVGVQGADRSDWESFRAPALSVLEGGRMPGTRARTSTRRTTRKPKPTPAPVASRNVLDDVHDGIARTVRKTLRKHGLDYRSVTVVSPTEVEVLLKNAG